MNSLEFNLKTVDLVTRMFTDPVLVLDPEPLADSVAIEQMEKQAALDSCIAPNMKALNSNKQMATLLKGLGVEPPIKVSPSTGKETYAFAKNDREFVALTEHENEQVAALVKARLRCKSSIAETRAESYLAVAERGTWPVDLNLSGAKTTHRLSGGMGGGGNPQNLGRGSPLRAAVCPPEDFWMFAVDSSNIELRIAMCVAGEREVVERMRDPDFDLYRLFAAHLYGKEEHEVTKAERLIGKIAMLSLQYGTGWQGFMNASFNWGVEVEAEEAMRIVALYRQTFPKIVRVWKQLDYILKKLERGEAEGWWMDEIVFANPSVEKGVVGFTMPRTGLSITYPNLRRVDGDLTYTRWAGGRGAVKEDVRIWGAKAFENICQALARNVVFEQQVLLDERLREDFDPACRTVMSIHDESICVVPDHVEKKPVLKLAEEIFGASPEWWPDLPVFGEAHAGSNYSECK